MIDKQKLWKAILIFLGMILLIVLMRVVGCATSQTLSDYAREHPEALEKVEKVVEESEKSVEASSTDTTESTPDSESAE